MMKQMSVNEECLELNEELSRHFLGPAEANGLSMIQQVLKARARGNLLYLQGEPEKIALIKKFLQVLQDRINTTELFSAADMRRIFSQFTGAEATLDENGVSEAEKPFSEVILTQSGRIVRPKTPAQQQYIEAIASNTVSVARGPAGTGKTYLATAMAIKALKEKRVSRVVLSRPVVEAGESLGYLPGDIKEKVDPHFKPLYDSIQEFIGTGKFEQFLRQGIIEITPLAYMRGRTFNESFVVLDEAQNTTLGQMRMVLTRLGYGSKMVVTGDHTQIDLPNPDDSSLLKLKNIIGEVESVSFIDLTARDVIRHEIVGKIIQAFDKFSNRKNS
jgi:phosphate starvation-inducible PhoH-like protein